LAGFKDLKEQKKMPGTFISW